MKQAYPVSRLMDVARLFESRSDEALRKMFLTARAAHLSPEWRKSVVLLARQVQQGRQREELAIRAARAGDWKQARAEIRQALEMLRTKRTNLRVKVAEPVEGTMDLGAWVLKEARRVAQRTSHSIQARRQP